MSENASNKNSGPKNGAHIAKSAQSHAHAASNGSGGASLNRPAKAAYTPVESEAVDIFKLLDQLEELPEKARHLPFKTLMGFDHEQFYYLVLKVRANLPEDMKKAQRVAKDSDRIVEEARDVAVQQLETGRQESARILDSAKGEASRLVDQAKTQAAAVIEHGRAEAAAMVESSEINRMAEAQAHEIIRNAEREAAGIRKGADGYACEVLNNLDAVMDKALAEVRRGKERLEKAVR